MLSAHADPATAGRAPNPTDPPLRVAYLTSAYGRPSDTFIRNEVDELRRMGCRVATFSIRKPPEPTYPDAGLAAHREQTAYVLEQGWTAIAAATLREAFRRPAAFARTLLTAWRTRSTGAAGLLRQVAYAAEATWIAGRLRQAGAQHLHNHIAENSASVAMLAAELAGISWSQTVHGPYIFFAPAAWRLTEKIEHAAFTVCITDFCRGQCMAFSDPDSWEKLKLVRCSVQEGFLAEPPAGNRPRGDGAFTFVSVGRLCAEKGQAVLLRAVARLHSEGRRFRLRLIGDGPHRTLLEREATRLGLREVVSMEGWQPSEAVRRAMADADAFVSSSFAEGLPIVLMESLALGRPVVATAIAGIPELVEDGRCGWLARSGSEVDLADAMRRALATPPNDRLAMGQTGRQRVIDHHHPREQTRKLLRLFAETATA